MKINPKLAILKRALGDPVVSSPEKVRQKDRYVSEWVSDGGPVIRATYRVHEPAMGRKLKKLYDSGFVGGRPKLSDVYIPGEF